MAAGVVAAQSMGVVNFASGTLTGDGSANTLTLGFVPRYVKVINETDVLVWEKFGSQVAANSIKTVTAGTTTVDTTSAIVINTDGTVTVSSGAVGSADSAFWVAFG